MYKFQISTISGESFMKKFLMVLFVSVIFISISIAQECGKLSLPSCAPKAIQACSSKAKQTSLPCKQSKFDSLSMCSKSDMQNGEYEQKILKVESKVQCCKNEAVKAEKAGKSDLATAYSDLAKAKSKLASGMKKIYDSKKIFLASQKSVMDQGAAFKGKITGTAAMFPEEKISLSDHIAELNKCIEMYDKEGRTTQIDGAATKGKAYHALAGSVKTQIDGLETVAEAVKDIKAVKGKINSQK